VINKGKGKQLNKSTKPRGVPVENLSAPNNLLNPKNYMKAQELNGMLYFIPQEEVEDDDNGDDNGDEEEEEDDNGDEEEEEDDNGDEEEEEDDNGDDEAEDEDKDKEEHELTFHLGAFMKKLSK
jgi:hypothetical protein